MQPARHGGRISGPPGGAWKVNETCCGTRPGAQQTRWASRVFQQQCSCYHGLAGVVSLATGDGPVCLAAVTGSGAGSSQEESSSSFSRIMINLLYCNHRYFRVGPSLQRAWDTTGCTTFRSGRLCHPNVVRKENELLFGFVKMTLICSPREFESY